MRDGGPAFPREDYQTDTAGGQCGMTLRDYFAAKAMQSIISLGANNIDNVGDLAYEIADMMLRARDDI